MTVDIYEALLARLVDDSIAWGWANMPKYMRILNRTKKWRIRKKQARRVITAYWEARGNGLLY